MTPERQATIEGLRNAIDLMGLLRDGETMADALLHHGQEDNVTKDEVQEFLEGKKAKAA